MKKNNNEKQKRKGGEATLPVQDPLDSSSFGRVSRRLGASLYSASVLRRIPQTWPSSPPFRYVSWTTWLPCRPNLPPRIPKTKYFDFLKFLLLSSGVELSLILEK